MDPIYVRFWTRKIEFWRRPRALWCFTGSSFRDQSILATGTKKTFLGPILEAKMATKIAKKSFRKRFQNGGDFWTRFKSQIPQARRNARSPGETTEGVPEAGDGSKSGRQRYLTGLWRTDFDVG